MDSVEVIVTRLDAGVEPLASVAALSTAERERAARLRHEADRRRFVAAHAALRALLGERAGAAPASLRIETGCHGKPALAGSNLHFSLSRCGELAAFAFARGRAVGVDVEAIRPIDGADAIARRTFPQREWRAYALLPERERVAGFVRSWTRTEALAKALGRGLALPPEALEDALEGPWRVHSFSAASGFAAAVAFRT
jgi:4'-phosphopantetheinyl transferase